jgi:hypothetical protein
VHLGHTGVAQCPLCCQQRGAGGDDIVDEQHPERPHGETRPELGRVEPLGPAAPGLWGTVGSVQQPPAGQPQLASHRPRQQLGLVEAALYHPGAAGGCPGDHIDRNLGQTKPAHHQPREMTSHCPPVAVLQRQQRATRHAVERHGGSDAVGVDDGTGGSEREPACPAQVGAGLVAAGAAVVEHGQGGHGSQPARGV